MTHIYCKYKTLNNNARKKNIEIPEKQWLSSIILTKELLWSWHLYDYVPCTVEILWKTLQPHSVLDAEPFQNLLDISEKHLLFKMVHVMNITSIPPTLRMYFWFAENFKSIFWGFKSICDICLDLKNWRAQAEKTNLFG